MKGLQLAKSGERLSVLCLGAHSDDIEIGAGGTLLSLMERGVQLDVHWCVLSGGGVRDDEGNYGHNADSDNTHGNSVYLTFFRNQLRGVRAPFDNQAGGRIDDASQPRNGPQRAAGLMAFSYWMTFAGNVLGAPGKMDGWVYETSFAGGKPGIWMLLAMAAGRLRSVLGRAATGFRSGNVVRPRRFAGRIVDGERSSDLGR